MAISQTRLRDPKLGFRTLGDWAQQVKLATQKDSGNRYDPDAAKLLRAATVFGNEGAGTAGGYAVPPGFADKIENLINEVGLSGLCHQVAVERGAIVTTATDGQSPWESSSLAWESEGATFPENKPSLKLDDVRLHKLGGLIPVTTELWDDAPGLSAYLEHRIAIDAAFKLNQAILTGSGAGQPLGIANSPSLIAVAKEGSQAADTILRQNLLKMYAALHVTDPDRVSWVCHPTVISQLFEAVPESIPSGKLFGFPVRTSQAAQVLGDLNDIYLGDFSGYMLASRSAKIVNSLHFNYDQDLSTFRYTMRVGGQPWADATLADLNGSGTVSQFVTLAERA